MAGAAGLALLDILEKESLIERVAIKGERLGKKLKEKLLPMAHVGDVRGTGFLWGIELVQDKKKQSPFPTLRPGDRTPLESTFRKGIHHLFGYRTCRNPWRCLCGGTAVHYHR